MTTFVLVHGGGHGGWCYAKVKRLLEKDGHEVFAPSLAGLAERAHLLSPAIDLDAHVTDVVSLLHHWDLRDVVLVGHSYGGMVITGVADRAADRVGKVVYLDAANPRNGQSLVDVAGPVIEAVRPMGETVDGVELVLLPGPDAGMFYGVTDPDDLAWMDARLTGHPWRCFEQPLVLHDESAVDVMPQYHIVCESTLATRDAEMIGEARARGRLWSVDTGHDLMITEPVFVADALGEIAAEGPERSTAQGPDPLEAAYALRRQVLGDDYVDRVTADFDADPDAQEFQDYLTGMAWGVWTRGAPFRTRDRSLLVLAMTAALGRMEEFRLHVGAAPRAGVADEEIDELTFQIAAYCGAPAAVSARRVIREVRGETS